MEDFNREQIDIFLGVIRKYMQVRGSLSQKDLASLTNVGVSTISRFINQKTRDLDPHLIAKIVAKLDIPLHEIIDFIAESYTDRFKRLVAFHEGEDKQQQEEASHGQREDDLLAKQGGGGNDFHDAFSSLGTAQKAAKATVNIGGRRTTIPFTPDEGAKNSNLSVRDKLGKLTPRQKAYLTDFLNLDLESKDLMVDLGHSLFRYFRQKGMDF